MADTHLFFFFFFSLFFFFSFFFLLLAFQVASKILDDFYCRNTYYALAGNVSKQELMDLELQLCFMLKFDLNVTPAEFELYCRALKTSHPTAPAPAPAALSSPLAAPPPALTPGPGPSALALPPPMRPTHVFLNPPATIPLDLPGPPAPTLPLQYMPPPVYHTPVAPPASAYMPASLWAPCTQSVWGNATLPAQHELQLRMQQKQQQQLQQLQQQQQQQALQHLHQQRQQQHHLHQHLVHHPQHQHQPQGPPTYAFVAASAPVPVPVTVLARPRVEYLPKFTAASASLPPPPPMLPAAAPQPTIHDPLGAARAWFDAPVGPTPASQCCYMAPLPMACQPPAAWPPLPLGNPLLNPAVVSRPAPPTMVPWLLPQPQLV